MKIIYRLIYLLLFLIGVIVFIVLTLADPLIWAIIGKSPACRFIDRYFSWVEQYKKNQKI